VEQEFSSVYFYHAVLPRFELGTSDTKDQCFLPVELEDII
jgi:hypothetical protein